MGEKEGETVEKSEDYGLVRGNDFPQTFYVLLLPSPCVKAEVYSNFPIPDNSYSEATVGSQEMFAPLWRPPPLQCESSVILNQS